MKSWITILATVLAFAMAFVSCKNEDTATSAKAGQAILTGTVVDATSGATIAGAKVTAQSVSLGVQTLTTGTAGTFSFTFTFSSDSIASVALTISRSGYLDTTMTLILRSGNVQNVSVLLVSKVANGPAIVNGVVKDQTTGTVLQGVTINATSLTLDPQTSVTNAGGVFSFAFPVDTTSPSNVPATVIFAVTQPGYRDTTITMSVYFGKTVSIQVRIVPRSATLINGQIVDGKSGAYIQNAKVKVAGISGAPVTTDSTTTDPLGRYQLPVTINAKAIVSLTFTKIGYRDSTMVFEVVPSSSPIANLTWTPKSVAASLHAVVNDGTNPLVGADVQLQYPGGTVQSAVSNILGEVDFVLLVDSSTIAQLITSKLNYRSDTSYVRIVPGGTHALGITLVSTTVTVSGLVSELGGSVLSGAVVTARGTTIGPVSTSTDLLGRFSFSFNVPTPEIVIFSATKTGYADTTTIMELRAGSVATPLIAMRKNSSGGGGIAGGGSAKTIAFLGANPQDVSVYGVGGKETVTLNWEVRDSVGTPINGAHATTLTFSWTDLGATIAPKEYVLPTSVMTNAVGQATTSFTSGTKAGVVQVTASTVVNGITITSSPVRIVVHAGFADQTHFTIATVAHNLPGWTYTAFLRDKISVLVGDKYSNPCDKGTALYFRTSAGVIQASGFTDVDGQASVDLISGNPLPLGSPYSAAPSPSPLDTMFHWVVARTIGENGSVVTDSTLLLWTGHTQIALTSPDTFHIANGGSRTFTFSVTDEWGHPLGAGTTISVVGTTPPPPDPNSPANQVQVVFDALTLPDTQVRANGTTYFSFAIADGTTNIDLATTVKVSIIVTSPNGNRTLTFSGIVY